MAGFTFAAAEDRVLSVGAYLLGAVELAVIVGALIYAAWGLRAAILPGWSGAPARVAEAILSLTAIVLLAELFGTFGLFGLASMLIASAGAAVGAHFISARVVGARGEVELAELPAPITSPLAIWLAAGAVAVVTAAWAVPTLAALAGGMDRADTLWYHMPLAARFAETGNLGRIDFFDPIFFASYYPANSEVFHATALLTFGRDILSPLLNLGWLALGLAASYCIGRPYGVGPQALIGGAIALGSQMLIEFQAGEALNDIGGVSCILAAVALLVNGAAARAQRALGASALAIAGLAAGLAAGMKLSFLAPVLALLVGLVVIAGRGNRVLTGAWFGGAAFLAGGYWYLRNAIAIGNPIPFTSFGPLDLAMPERSFELRPGFSVFHYATDFDVWSDWFLPGLDDSFGLLWPLVLAGFIGGGAYALWRGSEPLLRVLGVVVLFTTLAYVFTPLTAAGEEGAPIAFEWNVRYIAPAAAVGLALVASLPIARGSERARQITLGLLVVVFAATSGSLVQWQQGHVKGAVAAGVAVMLGFAALRWFGGRQTQPSHDGKGPIAISISTRAATALAGAAMLAALAAGYLEQRHYLERRYDSLSPQLQIAEAVRWARDLRGAKVAVSGVRGVFNQYPFYGTDLSNEVQWLGIEGDEGAYSRIGDCELWRSELAAGDYTHVVTMYDPFTPGALTDTKEGLWTREDSGAREILRDGPVSVFELESPPDPTACGDLPDLEPAELNGDSVNADPTANQP